MPFQEAVQSSTVSMLTISQCTNQRFFSDVRRVRLQDFRLVGKTDFHIKEPVYYTDGEKPIMKERL